MHLAEPNLFRLLRDGVAILVLLIFFLFLFIFGVGCEMVK